MFPIRAIKVRLRIVEEDCSVNSVFGRSCARPHGEATAPTYMNTDRPRTTDRDPTIVVYHRWLCLFDTNFNRNHNLPVDHLPCRMVEMHGFRLSMKTSAIL